jgi:hypothetical protein
VITGAGAKEIRMRPGRYTVEARKDGKVVRRELVNVTKNGRKVVRVSQEPSSQIPELTEWERSVAAQAPGEQVKTVVARLKELNPGFDGNVTPTIEDEVVTGLRFSTDEVDNIAPVRALRGLTRLDCSGTFPRKGKLADLSPLKGLSLKRLECSYTQVSELTALEGMPLTNLYFSFTKVSDLAPLKGMDLVKLAFAGTKVSDLSPLKGMKLQSLAAMYVPAKDLGPLHGMPLTTLDLYQAKGVTDLKPLEGMPLIDLNLSGLPVSDLSSLKDMTSLHSLVLDNVSVSDLTPLRGLKLEALAIKGTKVSDLSVLKTLPLKTLMIDYRPDRKVVLQSCEGLERINNKPAARFWKDVGDK